MKFLLFNLIVGTALVFLTWVSVPDRFGEPAATAASLGPAPADGPAVALRPGRPAPHPVSAAPTSRPSGSQSAGPPLIQAPVPATAAADPEAGRPSGPLAEAGSAAADTGPPPLVVGGVEIIDPERMMSPDERSDALRALSREMESRFRTRW